MKFREAVKFSQSFMIYCHQMAQLSRHIHSSERNLLDKLLKPTSVSLQSIDQRRKLHQPSPNRLSCYKSSCQLGIFLKFKFFIQLDSSGLWRTGTKLLGSKTEAVINMINLLEVKAFRFTLILMYFIVISSLSVDRRAWHTLHLVLNKWMLTLCFFILSKPNKEINNKTHTNYLQGHRS